MFNLLLIGLVVYGLHTVAQHLGHAGLMSWLSHAFSGPKP
jgi:hypothetical protein